MRFGFDKVFDENATQEDVYGATTKSLLDSVLDGFNSTVFAYGATGCGKTHTISGTPQHPGIIFLTCAELFERINALADEKEIDLTLSYLEIYNETIRDLLIPGGSKMGLQLREDTNQNIAVAGLSTHSPKSVTEVMNMILMGNTNRTMSPTEANATSSRSHAVLQINVMQKPRTAGLSENHMVATLSIIDLAGSERASVTKNRGERLLEGANINRSLLGASFRCTMGLTRLIYLIALGNCINALCDPHKSNHVPYRDSKLTRLLKFSLGGNCKTVMIVCVSPSSQHYEETHNTLKYADRAKKIKTKISRNTMNVNRHVSQYVKAIYDLRNEVEELKKRLNDSTKEAMEKITKQGGTKDSSMKEGSRKLKAAYEQSKDLRKERINDLKSQRMVERRILLVNSWVAAFDHVFENRTEPPPVAVYKMREEAEKVLSDLKNNQKYLQQRLAGPSWEKVIDHALQTSLRILQLIDGVTETDVSALTCEANLFKMTAERDILHAIAETEVDLSPMVHTLSKAHFETVVTLSQVMVGFNISEEQAIEEAKKLLFEVQKGASDAVSHIIKPNGELISMDNYKPNLKGTPNRRRSNLPLSNLASPIKPPSFNITATSPQSMLPKPSPRPVKVKTPKKGVKFGRKSDLKKRVRWQDEAEDTFVLDEPKRDESKRKRFEENPIIFEESIYDEPIGRELPPVHVRRDFSPPLEASQGIVAPPIRPRSNRLEVGFLSKNKDVSAADILLPTSSDSPLRTFDTDQAINRVKVDAEALSDRSSSSDDSKPWRANSRSTKSSMRKSIAGTHSKRRSPSGSSQISPNGKMFGVGHARRMLRTEKENNGSITTVLSPKSVGVKAGARRMTVSGASRISKEALLGQIMEGQIRERAGRESIGGLGGKGRWR